MLVETQHTGQCACGDITFTAHAEPLFMYLCHCKRCQAHSGGPSTAGVIFPKDKVTISGNVSSHIEPADSGNTMTLQFCPTCSVTVSDYSSGFEDAIVINAMLLDQKETFKPQAHCWLSSKVDWQPVDESLMLFDKNPE